MVTKSLVCLLLLATLLPAADKKSKSEKQPEATVVDFVAQRDRGLILIDGAIRIDRLDEPFEGLKVRFELLASNDKPVSGQDAVISEALIEQDDEIPFSLQCRDEPRAVSVQVIARGKKKMYLTLADPGPYPIE